MKRLVSALLALMMLYGFALAEGPGAPIAGEGYAGMEAPDDEAVVANTVFVNELSPESEGTEPEAPAASPEVADAEPEVVYTDPEASVEPTASPEPEATIAPTVLSYKKDKTKTVYLGSQYQFKVPGKKVTSYRTSAKKIATVSKTGLIKLKKTGKAKITARLKNGKKVVLTLKVADPLVPASVKIDQGSKATLEFGDVLQLTAAVSPATAPQDVTWKSGNEKIATVDEAGYVSLWDWGKVTITASTPNKKKATFTLIVKKPPVKQYMISHAMGGIDEHNYSNSLEAFQENYAEGHRVFEVDFEYTSDGKLVLCHDWKHDRFSGIKAGSKPSYKKFMKSKIYGEYTPMDIDDLLRLMAAYPDATFITDSKYTDTATIKKQFKYIVKRAKALGLESVLDRLVVEIYNEKMYKTIEKIHHFNRYVYTLYKQFRSKISKSNLKKVCAFCAENHVDVVAMPQSWWNSGFGKIIIDQYGLETALYTTNLEDRARELLDSGVTAVFTDYLPPLAN